MQNKKQFLPAINALIFIFLLSTLLSAGPDSLQPGAKIKIITHSNFSRTLIGELKRIKRDSIQLYTQYGSVGIPMKDIRDLYVAAGSRNYTQKGAIYGGVVGAVTFSLVASIAVNNDDSWPKPSTREAFTGGLVFGGLIGGGIGALIGKFTHRIIWKKINLPIRK